MGKQLLSEAIESVFADCADFNTREINIGGERKNRAMLCYLDGLVSSEDIGRFVLLPLSDRERFGFFTGTRSVIEKIMHGAAASSVIKCRESVEEIINDLINGFCALIFDGEGKALTFEVKSDVKRQVGEPQNEKVVKGAKDSFVETLRMNTALVRKKVRTPQLKTVETMMGERSNTKIAVIYIEGLTNPDFCREILRRISETSVDAMISTAVLEEYILDGTKSPFPHSMHTERVDKFSSQIVKGHIGILIDGLPLGYIVPITMAQLMRAPEDRAEHFITASALAALRWLSLFVTLFLPAFYVSVAMYHQEMMPTKLMMAIIQSKANVPFSTAAEVLAMLIAFEILQEAGLRLTQPTGETVSIIGALVVGQSAVEAQVVSPVVVIVVAVAGITGYTIPSQDLASAVRICRFILAVAAMFAGLFALTVVTIMIVLHLASLESLGVPYLSPFVDGDGGKFSLRAMVRPPFVKDKERDAALSPLDRRNQK